MNSNEEVEGQRLSLVENEGHAETEVPPQRGSFWKNLFHRGKSKDDPLEDSALLRSSPDLDRYDDNGELDDFRDDGTQRRSLLDRINSDDEGEDWDEDEQVERSMSHQLLSSRTDSDDDDSDQGSEEEKETNLLDLHSSEPILKYYSTPLDQDDESEEDESEGEEDEDSDSHSGESSEETDDDENERDKVPPLRSIPPRVLERSMSYNSYSDRGTSDDAVTDSQGRKRIQARIEGFGSKAPGNSNPRTLRQRFQDFATKYSMKKMNIATEDTMQRKTWVDRFDNVVDMMVPPEPEEEGYINAFQIGANSVPTQPPPTSKMPRPTGVVSHRRKQFGDINDATYIVYLECELQNKELEVASWKRRATELEAEVKRLNPAGVDDSDDSSQDSADSQQKSDDTAHESEIEWQTSVPAEGVLIEVEGTTETPAMVEPPTSPAAEEDEVVFATEHAPDGPLGDESEKAKEMTSEMEESGTMLMATTDSSLTKTNVSNAPERFDASSDEDEDGADSASDSRCDGENANWKETSEGDLINLDGDRLTVSEPTDKEDAGMVAQDGDLLNLVANTENSQAKGESDASTNHDGNGIHGEKLNSGDTDSQSEISQSENKEISGTEDQGQ